MSEIYEQILEIIKSSLDLLCNCQREKDIQNILATQLRCEVRKTLSSNLYPNVEIGQVFYHTIEGDFDEYQSNKYQNNQGIQPSMLYKDFKQLMK